STVSVDNGQISGAISLVLLEHRAGGGCPADSAGSFFAIQRITDDAKRHDRGTSGMIVMMVSPLAEPSREGCRHLVQPYCRNPQQPSPHHRRHGAEAGLVFRNLPDRIKAQRAA